MLDGGVVGGVVDGVVDGVVGGAVGGTVATAVVEGNGVATEADGASGLEGAPMVGGVGGSPFGSHPMSAMAATETRAADERPTRVVVSGVRRLVPQKTQAASFERT